MRLHKDFDYSDIRLKLPFYKDIELFLGGSIYLTLAKTEIIYPKNVGALVAMDFT